MRLSVLEDRYEMGMDEALRKLEGEFLFLTCGGTIDKEYEDGKGARNYAIGASVIPQILQELGFEIAYKIEEIMRKDSLDMGEEMSEDRIKVARAVDENIDSKRIIITHGTDTTPETARSIEQYIGAEKIKKREQVIVLVGSSKPYSDRITDAIGNVDFAVSMAEEYEKQGKYGVYVAMGGEMIPVNRALKALNGDFIDTRYELCEEDFELFTEDKRLVV